MPGSAEFLGSRRESSAWPWSDPTCLEGTCSVLLVDSKVNQWALLENVLEAGSLGGVELVCIL